MSMDINVAKHVINEYVRNILPDQFKTLPNPLDAISLYALNPNIPNNVLAELSKNKPPKIPDFNNFYQWYNEFKGSFERFRKEVVNVNGFNKNVHFMNVINSLAEFAKDINCHKFRSLLHGCDNGANGLTAFVMNDRNKVLDLYHSMTTTLASKCLGAQNHDDLIYKLVDRCTRPAGRRRRKRFRSEVVEEEQKVNVNDADRSEKGSGNDHSSSESSGGDDDDEREMGDVPVDTLVDVDSSPETKEGSDKLVCDKQKVMEELGVLNYPNSDTLDEVLRSAMRQCPDMAFDFQNLKYEWVMNKLREYDSISGVGAVNQKAKIDIGSNKSIANAIIFYANTRMSLIRNSIPDSSISPLKTELIEECSKDFSGQYPVKLKELMSYSSIPFLESMDPLYRVEGGSINLMLDTGGDESETTTLKAIDDGGGESATTTLKAIDGGGENLMGDVDIAQVEENALQPTDEFDPFQPEATDASSNEVAVQLPATRKEGETRRKKNANLRSKKTRRVASKSDRDVFVDINITTAPSAPVVIKPDPPAPSTDTAESNSLGNLIEQENTEISSLSETPIIPYTASVQPALDNVAQMPRLMPQPLFDSRDIRETPLPIANTQFKAIESASSTIVKRNTVTQTTDSRQLDSLFEQTGDFYGSEESLVDTGVYDAKKIIRASKFAVSTTQSLAQSLVAKKPFEDSIDRLYESVKGANVYTFPSQNQNRVDLQIPEQNTPSQLAIADVEMTPLNPAPSYEPRKPNALTANLVDQFNEARELVEKGRELDLMRRGERQLKRQLDGDGDSQDVETEQLDYISTSQVIRDLYEQSGGTPNQNLTIVELEDDREVVMDDGFNTVREATAVRSNEENRLPVTYEDYANPSSELPGLIDVSLSQQPLAITASSENSTDLVTEQTLSTVNGAEKTSMQRESSDLESSRRILRAAKTKQEAGRNVDAPIEPQPLKREVSNVEASKRKKSDSESDYEEGRKEENEEILQKKRLKNVEGDGTESVEDGESDESCDEIEVDVESSKRKKTDDDDEEEEIFYDVEEASSSNKRARTAEDDGEEEKEESVPDTEPGWTANAEYVGRILEQDIDNPGSKNDTSASGSLTASEGGDDAVYDAKRAVEMLKSVTRSPLCAEVEDHDYVKELLGEVDRFKLILKSLQPEVTNSELMPEHLTKYVNYRGIFRQPRFNVLQPVASRRDRSRVESDDACQPLATPSKSSNSPKKFSLFATFHPVNKTNFFSNKDIAATLSAVRDMAEMYNPYQIYTQVLGRVSFRGPDSRERNVSDLNDLIRKELPIYKAKMISTKDGFGNDGNHVVGLVYLNGKIYISKPSANGQCFYDSTAQHLRRSINDVYFEIQEMIMDNYTELQRGEGNTDLVPFKQYLLDTIAKWQSGDNPANVYAYSACSQLYDVDITSYDLSGSIVWRNPNPDKDKLMYLQTSVFRKDGFSGHTQPLIFVDDVLNVGSGKEIQNTRNTDIYAMGTFFRTIFDLIAANYNLSAHELRKAVLEFNSNLSTQEFYYTGFNRFQQYCENTLCLRRAGGSFDLYAISRILGINIRVITFLSNFSVNLEPNPNAQSLVVYCDESDVSNPVGYSVSASDRVPFTKSETMPQTKSKIISFDKEIIGEPIGVLRYENVITYKNYTDLRIIYNSHSSMLNMVIVDESKKLSADSWKGYFKDGCPGIMQFIDWEVASYRKRVRSSTRIEYAIYPQKFKFVGNSLMIDNVRFNYMGKHKTVFKNVSDRVNNSRFDVPKLNDNYTNRDFIFFYLEFENEFYFIMGLQADLEGFLLFGRPLYDCTF